MIRYIYEIKINESSKVYAQVKISNINQLPIKMVSSVIHDKIIVLVKEIVNLNKQELVVKHLEKELDHLIYDIYSLNLEEINIIENWYIKKLSISKKNKIKQVKLVL